MGILTVLTLLLGRAVVSDIDEGQNPRRYAVSEDFELSEKTAPLRIVRRSGKFHSQLPTPKLQTPNSKGLGI